MAKYFATAKTRPCPVCDKTNGNCRITDNELVLCMTFADAYSAANHPDYRYTKPTKDGMWGIYAPRTDQDFDREKWLREVEARQVETAQRNQAALSVEVRDRDIKVILSQLSLSDGDRAYLLGRQGFPKERLDYCVSVEKYQRLTKSVNPKLPGVNQWGTALTNGRKGILVAFPDADGYLVGMKFYDPTAKETGKSKSSWFSSSWLKNGFGPQLPNGENPIAVYWPQRLTDVTRIGLCEGVEWKAQEAANRLGFPVIGFSGAAAIGAEDSKTKKLSLNQQTTIEKITKQLCQQQLNVINENSSQQWNHCEKSLIGMLTTRGTENLLCTPNQALLSGSTHGKNSSEKTLNTQSAECITGLTHQERQDSALCMTDTELNSYDQLKIGNWLTTCSPLSIEVCLIPDAGMTTNSGVVKAYKRTFRLYGENYRVSVAWWGQFAKSDGDIDEIKNLSHIQYISPETFLSHCQGSADGKFKDWLGKQLKRVKPQGFGKPKIEGSEYDRDRRVETWLESFRQGISVKDGSLMGDGKTHSVPELADHWSAEHPGGKVWHLTPDHRNPTVKQIEDEFTDLFPRNKYGFYRDGQGKLVKGDKTNRGYITNGHCPSADLFPQLTTLGYDPNAGGSNNPICQACGHKEICSFVPGWYRNDRRATLQENKIRCHPDSLPSPGEYDYSKDLLVWDDFPFKPTKALTTTWGQLLLESDRVREVLTPEQYQFLDSVLQIVKPLFDDNSKYGLSLASPSDSQKLTSSQVSLLETVKQSVKQLTLENIKQDSDPLSLIIEKLTTNPLSLSSLVSETYRDPIANTLTKAERKQHKAGIQAIRAYENSEAIQKSRENLSQVPPNALIHLLKFLGGESGIVPRFHRGKLHLTLNNQARFSEIMHAAKANLFLDATQSQEDLQLKTGFNKPLTVIRAKSDQPLKNVTITQIKIPGIASKNISDTALGRLYAVSKELGKIDPNMPMIGHKAWLEMLNLDGHWFKDNRGSNDFIGRLNLALVGMPNPNFGAIQDEYLAVNGSLDGFEEYYQRLVNSEILQGVGRLRANRFPDQKFNVYALTPENADLSWLSEYGAKVIVKHSFEVSPDAGNERQLTLNKIIEAAANLTRDGLKVTQDAIAKLVGMTRGGVSNALTRKGINLTWIVDRLNKILATEPYKDPLRDSGQNWGDYQAFREVFELDPVLIAQEMIEIIQDGGLSKLTEFLDYFPKALQGKLLMILWALLTPDPDPPPIT